MGKVMAKKFSQMLSLLPCLQEVPTLNLSLDISNLDWFFIYQFLKKMPDNISF
jgi:hypothetical protein